MLNNERFMVPEVLFQPSDIGLQQGGLAQTIVEAVEATHPDLHPLLYSNVVCTGGCATCPGFQQRLYSALRALVPDDYEVRSCIVLSVLMRDLWSPRHAQDSERASTSRSGRLPPGNHGI